MLVLVKVMFCKTVVAPAVKLILADVHAKNYLLQYIYISEVVHSFSDICCLILIYSSTLCNL